MVDTYQNRLHGGFKCWPLFDDRRTATVLSLPGMISGENSNKRTWEGGLWCVPQRAQRRRSNRVRQRKARPYLSEAAIDICPNFKTSHSFMTDFAFSSRIGASGHLARLFWVFLALNIVFIFWSRSFLQPLETSEIVRFETAKTVTAAESIVRAWSTPDQTKLSKAIQSIKIDYIFIILYTIGLSVASIYLSNLTLHPILKRAGRVIPVLMLVAAICDVVENVSMVNSLDGSITKWNVVLTYDMAVTKFSIIILVLIFVLICVVFFLARILANKETSYNDREFADANCANFRE